MNDDVPSNPMRDPLMIAAFEGWNDAADSASAVIDHLLESWNFEVFAELDPDEFYDFQQVRPMLHSDDGTSRELIWPAPTVFLVSDPSLPRDVLLLRAFEPNFRWRDFCQRILALTTAVGARELYVLGALLADVPHTRPIQITSSSNDPDLNDTLPGQPSNYVGPVGITSVLADAAAQAGMLATSLWATVPHYTAEPPCPKASLALLVALDEASGLSLPMEPLRDMAEAWQRGADELMSDDDLREYVRSLEENSDSEQSPETSGDAIAKEFERYLRRRDRDGS